MGAWANSASDSRSREVLGKGLAGSFSLHAMHLCSRVKKSCLVRLEGETGPNNIGAVGKRCVDFARPRAGDQGVGGRRGESGRGPQPGTGTAGGTANGANRLEEWLGFTSALTCSRQIDGPPRDDESPISLPAVVSCHPARHTMGTVAGCHGFNPR